MFKPILPCLALCACTTSPPPNEWQDDANFFLQEIEEHHPNPAHATPLERLQELAEKASSDADVAKMVASVGDGHTILPVFALPGDDAPIPTRLMLPLRFEHYDDGLFVVGALRDHRELIGKKVTAIGTLDTVTAISGAREFLPQATPGFAGEYAPEWLLSDFVLSALGVVEGDTVSLSFADGTVSALELAAPDDEFDWLISRTDGGFGNWAAAPVETGTPPLELVERDGIRWWRITNLRSPSDEEWEAAIGDLAAAASDAAPLVIDARDCPGGNGDLVPDIIDAVRGSVAEGADKLYLAIGRRTHSACIMLTSAFRRETDGTVIGQATGDGANHYGETRIVTLPASGWRVIHSSKFWQTGEPDDRAVAIAPDVTIPFRHQDHQAGDPLAAWIKENIQ